MSAAGRHRLLHRFALVIALVLEASMVQTAPSERYLSHPPIRKADVVGRPAEKGPAKYVDPVRGKDANPGTRKAPWKTIGHALPLLSPGDTLYLRGGIYYENLYCAVVGRRDAPITIRSYPGETAIIQGGFREFYETPSKAWEPVQDGVAGEYRSTGVYRNIRDVLGLFGDSNVGLQTYWHRVDLQAENEFWIRDPDKKTMIKPVYCGPGLWYDKENGRIHVRLAHTHIQNPRVPNYTGETDPRKLPLIIAPFNSLPLFVDQAMHMRFQDLIIRGGGHNAVFLQFGVNLEFDNVVVFCGTYGLRAHGTGPMKFVNSALYGAIPPWGFRTENGLQTYTPDYYDPFLKGFRNTAPNRRNIARLNTHAVLVTEGSFEFEVFYYPHNHDWEIAHSEFTEGHDGVYLSGKHIRFHHNWVDNIQDDALYVSSPTPYFCDDLHIYQNYITKSLMAFSCHSRGGPTGEVYIYRNVADLREGVNADRPTPGNPQGNLKNYHIYLMHGRGFLGVESIAFYQNSLISPALSHAFAHRTLYNTSATTRRRVFNNIFVYLNAYHSFVGRGRTAHNIQLDGNVHWCSAPDAKAPRNYLDKVRNCAVSIANKKNYPPGWAAHSVVANPKFRTFSPDPDAANDYRLQKDSPAVDRGVALPEDLRDPLRPEGDDRPDAGAIPSGGKQLKVGRRGRITVGNVGDMR